MTTELQLSDIINSQGFARTLSMLADEASQRAEKKRIDGDLIGSDAWLNVAGELGRTARSAAEIR